MRILAFDPGVTTGACLIATEDDSWQFQVVNVLEIPWESRFATIKALIDGTYSIAGLQPPDAIVAEAFRLRQSRAYQQAGSDFPSSQVVGIIQAYIYDRYGSLDRYHTQEPVSMARVKILPEHKDLVAGSEHKKDAYKHARYFHVNH